jgi:hypothetical protein
MSTGRMKRASGSCLCSGMSYAVNGSLRPFDDGLPRHLGGWLAENGG